MQLPWIKYFNNPRGKDSVGDCTVRAISKVMGWDWDTAYFALCMEGYLIGDMPSGNATWISFLLHNGFTEHSLFSNCKDCYTLQDFAKEHNIPNAKMVVGSGDHVVAVIGDDLGKEAKWYDSWNSGNINPIYYFIKEEVNDDAK